MAKATIKGRIAHYMETGLGFKSIKSKTGKDGFNDPQTGKNYWLGKNGAVRVGRAPSRSLSVSEPFFTRMEQWEVTDGK
jgi:hypothetical protein